MCKGPGPGRAQAARLAFGCFQTLGNLRLVLGAEGAETEYRRSLSLGTAVAETHYRVGGVGFRREVFASHPR